MPVDVMGRPCLLGVWYWARTRTGKTLGVGRFLANIGSGHVLFWVGSAGYETDTFQAYELAAPPVHLAKRCVKNSQPQED